MKRLENCPKNWTGISLNLRVKIVIAQEDPARVAYMVEELWKSSFNASNGVSFGFQ